MPVRYDPYACIFSCDVLGTNTGHVPRHAKTYANLHAEYDRIKGLMTDAYRQFQQEVEQGQFPEEKHSLPIDDQEFSDFLEAIEKKQP